MKRMLELTGLVAALLLGGAPTGLCGADTGSREIKICVSSNAPPAVQQSAKAISDAAGTSPLLVAMGGNAQVVESDAFIQQEPLVRAYNHLIVVGLPDDPLVQLVWQREAKVEQNGFYIFDFGHLQGTIGYIESDRNPFMHSAVVASAPYETEIVTITGSTPAAVALAADAFIKKGLVNGVIATDWRRPSPTLLDHDPLDANFEAPAFAPDQIGDAVKIGVTQAGESEYRGVLADTTTKPLEIWRFKYYVPGAWDGAGFAHARSDYLAGLHRRAYGNTLWLARFGSPEEAQAAVPLIAAAARLRQNGQVWSGLQPTISTAPEDAPGPLNLWQHGQWVVMSTLREAQDDSVLTAPQ